MDWLQRREFIAILGGVATLAPFAARAQDTIPLVGFLRGARPDAFVDNTEDM